MILNNQFLILTGMSIYQKKPFLLALLRVKIKHGYRYSVGKQ